MRLKRSLLAHGISCAWFHPSYNSKQVEGESRAELNQLEGDVHVQLQLNMGQLEAVDDTPLANLSDMALLPRYTLCAHYEVSKPRLPPSTSYLRALCPHVFPVSLLAHCPLSCLYGLMPSA